MAMDENNREPIQNETEENQAKVWIQDNLRIIVSVFIVAAIALGIYSYSQRTDTTQDADLDYLLDTRGGEEGDVAEGDATEGMTEEGAMTEGEASAPSAPVETSRETDTSFIQTASAGEGTTHLARHALANYLEKSPDSALTNEHKVYIEDYLRKHANHQGALHTGDSVEFSKAQIQEAINASKNLSERQLQNLKKYSSRVSSFE